MRLRGPWVAFLLCFAFLSSNLQAQQGEPSLGDLARKERERKKSGQGPPARSLTEDDLASSGAPAPGSTEVRDGEVGVRLVLPPGWKVMSEPYSPSLELACPPIPGQSFLCFLIVTSSFRGYLPEGKNTITEADLKPIYAAIPETDRVSSRYLSVAGYPAHELVYYDRKEFPQARVRAVIVFAGDIRRTFGFILVVDRERFAERESLLDPILKSFSPLEVYLVKEQPGARRNR